MASLDVGLIQNRSISTWSAPTGTSSDYQEAEAVAKDFEGLLVEQMIKGMRKTTLSQGASNAMQMYDDMLGQSLSDEMVKSGSLGIADQILRQIRQTLPALEHTKSAAVKNVDTDNNLVALRQLARDSLSYPPVEKSHTTGQSAIALNTGISADNQQQKHRNSTRLAFIEKLWGGSNSHIPSKHSEFLMPLFHQAKSSADSINTKASAILAIAALETGWGTSFPTHANGISSNNLFGIKSTKRNEAYASNVTTEFIDGTPRKLLARFKSYGNTAESIGDFVKFLQSNPRYQEALSNAGEPEQFLRELQQAGYATDPNYADKAISIMKQINSYGIQ